MKIFVWFRRHLTIINSILLTAFLSLFFNNISSIDGYAFNTYQDWVNYYKEHVVLYTLSEVLGRQERSIHKGYLLLGASNKFFHGHCPLTLNLEKVKRVRNLIPETE